MRKAFGPALRPGNKPYTRFCLNARPRDLTTDLRFQPASAGFAATATSWLMSQDSHLAGLIVFGVMFAVLSRLAALAARRAFPNGARPSGATAAALGLFNFATILGVFIAAIVAARMLGAPVYRGVRFVLVFSVVFCSFLLVLFLLTLPIG